MGFFRLKAAVGCAQGQDAFHVIDYGTVLAPRFDAFFAEFNELVMAHGQDDGGVLAFGRGLGQALQTVFVFGFLDVNPGVVHVHLGVVSAQGFDDVHYFGVAHVRAVFFEGEAKHQHFAAEHWQVFAEHELDGFVGHMARHAVVDATARQNHFGVVADFLRFVRQVIRVYANAVPTHKAGPEGQEVPLGACGFEHFERVNTEFFEDEA